MMIVLIDRNAIEGVLFRGSNFQALRPPDAPPPSDYHHFLSNCMVKNVGRAIILANAENKFRPVLKASIESELLSSSICFERGINDYLKKKKNLDKKQKCLKLRNLKKLQHFERRRRLHNLCLRRRNLFYSTVNGLSFAFGKIKNNDVSRWSQVNVFDLDPFWTAFSSNLISAQNGEGNGEGNGEEKVKEKIREAREKYSTRGGISPRIAG